MRNRANSKRRTVILGVVGALALGLPAHASEPSSSEASSGTKAGVVVRMSVVTSPDASTLQKALKATSRYMAAQRARNRYRNGQLGDGAPGRGAMGKAAKRSLRYRTRTMRRVRTKAGDSSHQGLGQSAGQVDSAMAASASRQGASLKTQTQNQNQARTQARQRVRTRSRARLGNLKQLLHRARSRSQSDLQSKLSKKAREARRTRQRNAKGFGGRWRGGQAGHGAHRRGR